MNRALAPLAAALALASACHTFDIGQPIALIADSSFAETERRLLAEAASCWNDAFGTDLRVPASGHEATASGVLQQAQVGYLEFVCAFATGRTDNTEPVRISICPLEYFLSSEQAGYKHYRDGALFVVLVHEIGHVLNITTHASSPRAVMNGEGDLGASLMLQRFHAEDRELLQRKNPEFSPRTRCPEGCELAIWAFSQNPRCECR